jgi:hypothetical protein
MAQNTRWPDERTHRADNSGATIMAVIAVIILVGLVYLATHGLSTSPNGAPLPASPMNAPSAVAPNPAPPTPAAPTAPAAPPTAAPAPAPAQTSP